MKTKSLFGIQFVEQSRFKTEVLENFEGWKVEKKRFFNKQLRQYDFLIHLWVQTLDANPGLTFDQSMKLVQQQLSENPWDELIQPGWKPHPVTDYCNVDFNEVQELLREEDCIHYYVTKSVLRECERLRTKEPFDLGWLSPIEDGKRQLNIGQQFLRYQKVASKIVALSGSFTLRPDMDRGFFQYTFFNMDLVEKTQTPKMLDDEVDDLYNLISPRDFDRESRKLFFQLLTFMELAPLEEVFLPAGRKHGTKKSESCLLNETAFPITIINANWNRVIHVGRIDVRCHYKSQACGPGGKYRELIFISDYYKEGYNLSAGRTKLLNRNRSRI